MQHCYSSGIENICKAIGNNVILQGCEVTGGNIANGVLILNGEVLPFEGGANLGFVAVQQMATNELYHYYGGQPFYHTRKAVTALSGQSFNTLVRLNAFKDHVVNYLNPHHVTKAQAGLGNLPNNKSDSLEVDDTNVLASAKAVFEMAKWQKIICGSKYVGNLANTETTATITHNAGTLDYNVCLTICNATALVEDTLVTCNVIAKTENTIEVRFDEYAVDYTWQEITLNWLIYKY